MTRLLEPAALLPAVGGFAYAVVFLVVASEGIPLLGPLMPGQAFLAGAAFLGSRTALFDPALLAAVAFVAAVAGSGAGYLFGRHLGNRLLDLLPAFLRGRARALADGLAGHLGKSLVVGRWLSVPRGLGPPLAGAAGVPPARFAAWDLLACALWAPLVVAIGWLFGATYARVEEALGNVALALVALALVAYLLWRRWQLARDRPPG